MKFMLLSEIIEQGIKFEEFPYNRKKEFRKDLQANMRKNGFLGTCVACYTEWSDGLMLIDGHQRVFNAQIVGVDPVIKIEDKVLKTIEETVDFASRLNSTQRNWNLMNYIYPFMKIGKKGYDTLYNLLNNETIREDASEVQILSILSATSFDRIDASQKTNVKKEIHEGRFEIVNLKWKKHLDMWMKINNAFVNNPSVQAHHSSYRRDLKRLVFARTLGLIVDGKINDKNLKKNLDKIGSHDFVYRKNMNINCFAI